MFVCGSLVRHGTSRSDHCVRRDANSNTRVHDATGPNPGHSPTTVTQNKERAHTDVQM